MDLAENIAQVEEEIATAKAELATSMAAEREEVVQRSQARRLARVNSTDARTRLVNLERALRALKAAQVES